MKGSKCISDHPVAMSTSRKARPCYLVASDPTYHFGDSALILEGMGAFLFELNDLELADSLVDLFERVAPDFVFDVLVVPRSALPKRLIVLAEQEVRQAEAIGRQLDDIYGGIGDPVSRAIGWCAIRLAELATELNSVVEETAADVSSPSGDVDAIGGGQLPAPQVPRDVSVALNKFSGGTMVFFLDRVELCGVDICSGPRSQTRRKILDMLRRKQNDECFVAYSADELAVALEPKGSPGTVSGAIRDLRAGIMEALRNRAKISCGRQDVILSGKAGYQFSPRVTVQDDGHPEASPITDTAGESDVPNVRNDDVRNVRNVRNDAGRSVPNVPDGAAGGRRAWILQQLAEEHELQAPVVAKQFKCSVKTAQRDLMALKEDGEIEFVGATRTGFYRLHRPPASGK